MSEIISDIHTLFGFSVEHISQAIAQRALPGQDLSLDLGGCLQGDCDLPAWVERAAALWVMDLWTQERDACNSADLLTVDRKYSRILRRYSMADIISFRKEILAKR